MIGVYKITSPSGKIYIGQSINIEARFRNYKRLACKKQLKIYNSLLKYSPDKHVFEIIEESSQALLNKKERYWQDLYNSVEKGLNLQYVETEDKSGGHSQSTKDLLRKINTGKKLSEETKEKIKLKNSGENHANFGKTLKLESINKRSEKRNRTILDLTTGIFYFGTKEVSEIYGINRTTLIQKLNGRAKNNTNFKVV